MRVNVTIRTKHQNDPMELVNYKGEYIETEDSYMISYIESLYDNLITVYKTTDTVVVERQGTVISSPYYSKLVFEKHKSHRCAIDVEGYHAFVEVETINTLSEKTNTYFKIMLDYIINNDKTYVEIMVE